MSRLRECTQSGARACELRVELRTAMGHRRRGKRVVDFWSCAYRAWQQVHGLWTRRRIREPRAECAALLDGATERFARQVHGLIVRAFSAHQWSEWNASQV